MDIPHVVSDIDKENVSVVEFRPHVAPTNCLSVSTSDDCKIYSTSHDGTMLCVNLEKMIFENMFATDFKSRVKHLTWHKEREADTFLITHGNGRVGIMDMRKRGASRVDWIKCFPRSARTVDIHPTNNNYFLVSSGTGSCCIFDMRNARQTNPVAVCQMNHPKGLTSAFFSGLGNYVLTTCNDDFLRVYDVKNLGNSRLISQTVHNNHTGKWLSVFKAIWYPSREDAFLIGDLKKPRRIQIYGRNGKLINELRNKEMTTVSPVIAVHPHLPLIVGGNSSGKIHAFQAE
ncbi:hypothetical protein AAG570_001512 [Ranatra chinensis]|uniref:WD repeat-containing protein 76 n=1 Tax=Ranatra chinensis TaxID=642074 RepID=A0ABD0YAP4_9HEMI